MKNKQQAEHAATAAAIWLSWSETSKVSPTNFSNGLRSLKSCQRNSTPAAKKISTGQHFSGRFFAPPNRPWRSASVGSSSRFNRD
jgi:hypothetical protein